MRSTARLGAAPVSTRASWLGGWVGHAASLILGAAEAAAFSAALVTEGVDPRVCVLMAAISVFALGLSAWALLRAPRRWSIAAALLVGGTTTAVGSCLYRPDVEQPYWVDQCLGGNREACRQAFLHGWDHDDDSKPALAPACRFGVMPACDDLWKLDAATTCAIVEETCGGGSSKPGRYDACDIVAEKCRPADAQK